MSADHFFAANSRPIANFTSTKITLHVPTTANALTIANGLTTNGNVVCMTGSHVAFAAGTGPLIESNWGGGNDRYGIAVQVPQTIMYAANLGVVDTFVCMSFCTSADTYFDAVAANPRDVIFNVDARMGRDKMLRFSNTMKPNMIEIVGQATPSGDPNLAYNVRGLGMQNGIMLHNTRENEFIRMYAGDNRLLHLSNTEHISYRDTEFQKCNVGTYQGVVCTTVGVIRCQVGGAWPNKVCLYAPEGVDSFDRSSTNVSALGTATNALQVRSARFDGGEDSFTAFRANVNSMGSVSWGPLTGNGASGKSARLRLGPGYPTWQVNMDYNSAIKPATSTWSTTSDESLKTDIEMANLDICYATVRALPLKRFGWLDPVKSTTPDEHVVGWIAQDVEHFLPKAVTITNEHGIEDFRVLNQDQILKAMYGALQLAMSKIETLEAELGEAETLVAGMPTVLVR